MLRHLARLADETFDVVVVGGGVYGLSAALALVERGCSVALLERRDFGGATSFNSLKTVHGGIRALQHGAIADAREFVRERRAIAIAAPHLLRVLPFVVPTSHHPLRNRAVMSGFLQAYDLLASDRNDGVDPALHLPPSYTVGRRRALDLNALVDDAHTRGGAVWHDYQLVSPERYAMALARTISEAGGAIANYVVVRRILRDGNRVTGIHAEDALGTGSFDVRARAVVNAAGPWSWRLLADSGVPPGHDDGFSLALNLVLDRPPLAHAVGGLANDRFVFLVPWRDRSILGTSHEGFHQDPATRAGAEHVEALLRDGEAAFPRSRPRAQDVQLVHRGLLPARPAGHAHGALLKRSIIRDHRAEGFANLVSVVGVRYTTARATAQAAADRILAILGRTSTARPPRPLAGAAFNGLEAFRRQHANRVRVVARYGTHHGELDAEALIALTNGTEVTRAEVLHAIRHEMAHSLADVALRRTDLAAGGHPGRATLEAAARVMAAECSWNTARVDDEIAALEAQIAL